MVVIDVFVTVAIAVVRRVIRAVILIFEAALIVIAVGVAVAKIYYDSNCDKNSSLWSRCCSSRSSFVGATAAAVVLVVIVLVIRSAVLVIVRETAAGVRIRKVTAAVIRLAEPAIVVIAVGVTAAEATITCGPVVR